MPAYSGPGSRRSRLGASSSWVPLPPRAAALPGKLEPLSHRVFRGRRVWILRDVDLMRDDAARYDQMLAFLQNALQSFLPR